MPSHTPPRDETQASVHDTAKIKLLKIIVGVMGVLLVVAFLTVIGTIAYRIMTKGDAPKVDTPIVTESVKGIAVDVLRPDGGTLMSMEVEGHLVYLLFTLKDGGETILVLDNESGHIVRRISIK